MSNETFDALLIINQNTDIKNLHFIQITNNLKYIIVLSTHKTFPYEEKAVKNLFMESKFITFADLLSEDDMCQCDKDADELVLSQKFNFCSKNYELFEASSLRFKNKIVHEKIIKNYKFHRIYYSPGLGIDPEYWRDFAVEIPDSNSCRHIIKSFKEKIITLTKKLTSFIERIKTEIYIIRHHQHTYVFVSTLKRLHIAKSIDIQAINVDTNDLKKYISLSSMDKIKGFKKLTQLDINSEFNDELLVCATIHDYPHTLISSHRSNLIFVDGFHPSNYPYSYLHAYEKDEVFVPRNMFDESWFAKYEKKTIKPPQFIELDFFQDCSLSKELRALLALNHAGDWTSLINRSDTDYLILLIANIASQFPQIIFRVRPHPTMSHSQHEGVNSLNRLSEFLSRCRLSNLEFSTSNLDDDLEWSTVCLSEYSQVLLDAWKIGKLGISINTTKRRSFMQDYSNLGFLHANSSQDLIKILNNLIDNPLQVKNQQNEAVSSYNNELSKWISPAKP